MCISTQLCLISPPRHTYIVQFVVEAASIAHRFTLVVAPPERRRGGLAVGAGEPRPSVVARLLVRSTGRPVHAVGAIEEAAGVAQVVAGAVTTPQRRRHCAAVDALPRSIVEVVTF